MSTTDAAAEATIWFPEDGVTAEELRLAIAEARRQDIDWRDGRKAGPGGPVYFAGEDVLAVAREAYLAFFSENALYTRAFPSIQGMERDLVKMTSALLHNDEAVGTVTSGGTESILLAVKAARDRARALHPEISEPEIVAPAGAHPAFNKAAHFFGLKIIRTPLTDGFRADLRAYEAAITKNTVLMVGSAPDYSFGILDPIPEMAAMAADRGINFHTDACLGGFFLPFLEQLGQPMTPFDFRVPGVASISADLHKFGYAARGASTVIWRDEEHYRYQPFEFDDWPSGMYRTAHLGGSRGGGAIAAAWAAMRYLGGKGYRAAAERSMALIHRVREGVAAIPDLEIFGDPVMCIFSYGSRSLDIFAVASGMEERGWSVARGKEPPHIHVMIFNALTTPWVGDYLRDLREVTELVRTGEIGRQEREVRYA